MQLETCDLYENILPSGILDGLGGVPKSSICAEAISQGWFQPLERQGFLQVTDEFTTTDASKTFFASMERYFAMRVLKHGRGGEGEGIFKEIAKSAIEERQVVGVHDMRMLCYG